MILKEFSDWQEEGLGYKEISQEDSKNERIIKGIYNALKYLELELSWDLLCDEPYVDILDAYDWLEKKGEQRTEMIEKACEWLANELPKYILEGCNGNLYYLSVAMVDDFKKAMKGD